MKAPPLQPPRALLLCLLFLGSASADCDPFNPCFVNGICVNSDQCDASLWSRALIWFSIGAGILVGIMAAILLVWFWKRKSWQAMQRPMQYGQSQQPVAGVALAVVPSNTPVPGETSSYTPPPTDRKEEDKDLENPHPHPEDDAGAELDDGMYGPLVDVPALPTTPVTRPAEPAARAQSWWRV